MSTYADFLKSQGATEADIAIFDTPIGRKAFDAQQAAVAAAVAEAEKVKANSTKYKEDLDKWFGEQSKLYTDMEKTAIEAQAKEAKARAYILAAQKQGLLQVSDDMGWKEDAPNPNPNPNPNFDPSKYATMDNVKTIADGAGDNIAGLTDLIMEHQALFPGKTLKVRELRREAVAAGKTVEQLWMERFDIPKVRADREAAEKAAYEKKLIEQGAAEERSKMASIYGNPNARPPMPSSSPFTKRAEGGRDKQPWERGGDASSDRVNRATTKLIERESGRAVN